MAFLSKKKSPTEDEMVRLGERFMSCLKFKLQQDGIELRGGVLEAFGKWIVSKPTRVARYESGDMTLVTKFIDFAWEWIVDPKHPMPVEPIEPPKPTTRAQVREAMFGGQPAPAPPQIDWDAINQQLREDARRMMQQRELEAQVQARQQIPVPAGNAVFDAAANQWIIINHG